MRVYINSVRDLRVLCGVMTIYDVIKSYVILSVLCPSST